MRDFDVFDKPSLSIDDQVERLIDRGLEADPERLRAVLARISYYRLSGYLWWWYEDDAVGERFRPGTTLDSVLDLYRFDAELRALVLLLAHDIEVWLRGALANQLAEHHGADGYVQPELYQNPAALEGDLEKLKGLFTRRSPELFVRAFRERYGEDAHPPIWMATEVMSLGLLSKWYGNLRNADAKPIADQAGLPVGVLGSFLHEFTILRNGAAHHSRIWNRVTATRLPKVRRPPRILRDSLDGADRSRIQAVLAIAVYVVRRVAPESDIIRRLRDHVCTAPEEWLHEMDFPAGFEKDPLWSGGDGDG